MPTDKLTEKPSEDVEQRQYDALIETLQDALADFIEENGTVRCAIFEAALGYHLSAVFDHYDPEIRPAVIENFCNTLKSADDNAHLN